MRIESVGHRLMGLFVAEVHLTVRWDVGRVQTGPASGFWYRSFTSGSFRRHALAGLE